MSCLTCTFWRLADTSQEWTDLGYAVCKFGPSYTVHSPIDSCDRHQPCKPATQAKRQQWAADRAKGRSK